MTMALDEQIKTYDLYLSMRLAPMTLQSCYHLNHDMNNLEWRFVSNLQSNCTRRQAQ